MTKMFSVFSIIIAIVAVCVSVISIKRQTRLQLFEKRYKIYELFSMLVFQIEMVITPSLTYKGHVMMWYTLFSCENGFAQVDELEEQLFTEKNNFEGKAEPIASKEALLNSYFIKTYSLCNTRKSILSMSHLLFEKEITDKIDTFCKLYTDLTMIIGYEKKESEKILEKWSDLCNEIRDEKILEKMEEKIKFLK